MESEIRYVEMNSHDIFCGYSVFLGRQMVGSIKKATDQEGVDGWAYYPKGKRNLHGEVFNTIEEVKSSVEGTDDDDESST